ncbi:MAG: protein-export chaperone SecB [Candidatus Dormibacteria bacterium]
MTDTDAGQSAVAENGQTPPPGIRILAQFIRDLSFESPHAPEALRPGPTPPQIDLGVELNVKGRDDALFEVEIKLNARAVRESETVFNVELVYAGLFQIQGVPPSDLELVLMVECPRYLFPFARRIIGDLSIDGGFPPFLLEPIDFAGIYAARKAQSESAQGGTA